MFIIFRISTDSLTEKLAHLSDVEQEVTDTKQINRHMHDELQALKLDRDITNEKLEFSVNNNNILRLELQELKMQQLEMIKDLQKPKVEMVVDVAQVPTWYVVSCVYWHCVLY